MNYWKKFGFIVLAVLMLASIGCSSGVEKWVKKKGFVYYPDYRESEIMGHLVQRNGQIVANPCISNLSQATVVPEQTQLQIIEGSEKIKDLLQRVTKTPMVGDFFQAKQAILTLRDLSQVKLTEIIPTGPCNNFRMDVVTELLNAASMSVVIKDAGGNDITYLFKPVSETAVPPDVVFGRPIFITGRHFHLGYKTESFFCKSISQKIIQVMRDQTINDTDVALQVRYMDYEKRGYENIALMRIMISGFIPEDQTDMNIIKSNQFIESQDPSKTWVVAHKPENGRLKLPHGGIVQVFEGVRGGIAAKTRSSGIYFEVLTITEQEVKIRVQYISYLPQ